MKTCRVSFRDNEGIAHSVDVDADSLYEAIGRAIARFVRAPYVDPPVLTAGCEFIVEPREPNAEHRVPLKKFEAWLDLKGGTPREMGVRFEVRKILARK